MRRKVVRPGEDTVLAESDLCELFDATLQNLTRGEVLPRRKLTSNVSA
jgi:hypothetical protein